MLNYLKEFFSNENTTNQQYTNERNHQLQIAACSLLLEIAQSDEDFSEAEKTRIYEIIKNEFKLSDEEVNSLILQSEKQIEKSVSVYEFTDILNHNLSSDEKFLIIKYLWQIAYADGNLDSYEEYYIKKVSNNLHLHNKDRVVAKLQVKQELGIN